MNDRIAQMAREAELIEPRDEWDALPKAYTDAIIKLIGLVAEDCAGIADQMAGIYWDGDGASSAEQVSRDIRARYSKD
jgi:hypothetical protein